MPRPNLSRFHQSHITLPDGAYIITCDWHAPFYSELWAYRLLEVSRRSGIRKLIIAGDGLDLASLSHWGADPEMSFEQEMGYAADWLWTLYHWFDEIYYTRGNHSDRIARVTNWQVRATTIIDSLLSRKARDVQQPFQFDPQKLVVSNFPYLTIADKVFVCHPTSYSRLPLTIGRQLAVIHDMHVIGAHSHFQGHTKALNGKYVFDCGGMFDETMIRYRYESITTHGPWSNGFLIYCDGYITELGEEPQTDWREIDASIAHQADRGCMDTPGLV